MRWRGATSLRSRTKNRRKGFQPPPAKLVKLATCADSGVVSQLYQRFFSSFAHPKRALLYVPSRSARELNEDLQAAKIPRQTKDGKLDFAALRNSYVTLAAEAGANVKELQTLAHHSTSDLTLNVYAKKRDERLTQLAEKISESVFFEPECANSVHRKYVESVETKPKLIQESNLGETVMNGGGGIRTPVPRCFKTSFYMLSRFIVSSPYQAPNDRLLVRLFRN
jgi:hypothetical protein